MLDKIDAKGDRVYVQLYRLPSQTEHASAIGMWEVINPADDRVIFRVSISEAASSTATACCARWSSVQSSLFMPLSAILLSTFERRSMKYSEISTPLSHVSSCCQTKLVTAPREAVRSRLFDHFRNTLSIFAAAAFCIEGRTWE